MADFLVETCLLCHGLVSISSERIAEAFGHVSGAGFGWISDGKVHIGDLDEFLALRSQKVVNRASLSTMDYFLGRGETAALTTSGTLKVCEDMGIAVAVSCGLGGISNIPGMEFSSDLTALSSIPVPVIATSPKDMMDIGATVEWLQGHSVRTLGVGVTKCTGYVFNSADIDLDGEFGHKFPEEYKHELILNPIPNDERIQDSSILKLAIARGQQAQSQGKYFHPAVNAALDEMTDGLSSELQLRSVVANARLAAKVVTEKGWG